MLYSLIKRVGLKSLLSHPSLFPKLIDLVLENDYNLANNIFLKISKSHQQLLSSKKLQQQDKLTNFLCDLHLQNHSVLNSGIYDEYNWMYSKVQGQIWLSRAWIWAIQSELGLNLIPQELFFIDPEKNKHVEYANFVHYIHRATYKIIEFKGIEPSFSVIYRNVIEDNRIFTPKIKIGNKPMVEFHAIELDGALNIRCCSLKPHACENYDFTANDNNLFVVARGMEEARHGEVRAVLPTVLFTFNYKDITRFKSNADYKDVMVFDMEHIDRFLYLYEP